MRKTTKKEIIIIIIIIINEDDLIGPAPTNVGGPKSEKSNGGKYEIWCCRQRDGD